MSGDFIQNIDFFQGPPEDRWRGLFIVSFPPKQFRCATDGRIVVLDETGVDESIPPAPGGVVSTLGELIAQDYQEVEFPQLGEQRDCTRCGGSGYDSKICGVCDGLGSTECEHCRNDTECHSCDGTGYRGYSGDVCWRCNGSLRCFPPHNYVVLCGTKFSSFYLSRIDLLPDRKLFVSQGDELKFTYATGSGYVMRMR